MALPASINGPAADLNAAPAHNRVLVAVTVAAPVEGAALLEPLPVVINTDGAPRHKGRVFPANFGPDSVLLVTATNEAATGPRSKRGVMADRRTN
jgi:hypothetical protein